MSQVIEPCDNGVVIWQITENEGNDSEEVSAILPFKADKGNLFGVVWRLVFPAALHTYPPAASGRFFQQGKQDYVFWAAFSPFAFDFSFSGTLNLIVLRDRW